MATTSRAAVGIGLVGAVAAAVGTGCGGLVTESQVGAPAKKPHAEVRHPATTSKPDRVSRPAATTDSNEGGVGSTGSIIFYGDSSDAAPTQQRPAQDLYAAFRRTPRADDREAAAIARADAYVDPTDPTDDPLGEPIYSETRLVSGTSRHGLYALPTNKGAVCTGVIPGGGGGCGDPGPHGLTVGYDDPADGSPFNVYGLVGDDVRAIDVVVGGVTRHVQVVDNGYMLEVAGARRSGIQNLVLHLRDGTTDVLF